MTIKSDRWIREMAESRGMIEPFEATQVRRVDGRPVISFMVYTMASKGLEMQIIKASGHEVLRLVATSFTLLASRSIYSVVVQ